MHLKISMMARLLKGSRLILMFLFVELYPVIYIKGVNEILKLNCVRFSFSYIGQDNNWTLANVSLNPELFSSDKSYERKA